MFLPLYSVLFAWLNAKKGVHIFLIVITGTLFTIS